MEAFFFFFFLFLFTLRAANERMSRNCYPLNPKVSMCRGVDVTVTRETLVDLQRVCR